MLPKICEEKGMPNPYNPNPYNEDQDRARQQPLYDQPGGPRPDASQEYHKGDGVFQIPWWVIVITFCFAAWPIGVAMMIINHLAAAPRSPYRHLESCGIALVYGRSAISCRSSSER